MICRQATECRLCGSSNLLRVLALNPTPPANEFLTAPREQTEFLLTVMACQGCGAVQLEHTVDPEILFRNYVYTSGTSPSFMRHFEDAAIALVQRYDLLPGDAVVSIGSNDGTDLKPYKALGMRVYGFDPAVNIAGAATEAGIPTMCAFFDRVWGKWITQCPGALPKLIIANNVFAHADDLGEILRGVHASLAPDGAFVFEVQYAADLLRHGLFDMIYHEHIHYHTVRPLKRLLAQLGFTLVDVEPINTHGGSIRCHAMKADSAAGPKPKPSVREYCEFEEALNAQSPATWAKLANEIKVERKRLLTILDRFSSVVAYGAPAKFTTFTYQMGIAERLKYVVDDSPLKQGLYTPGSRLLVRSPEVLYRDWPKCVLVTAWNFAGSILEKHRALANGGVEFVVPFSGE